MSNKSNTPAHAGTVQHVEHAHEHEDDLIVAPKGTNRLRFLLTLALVLFVLIMFVVADQFQYLVGGAGRGFTDPVYVSWHDPVGGTDESRKASEFESTSRTLQQLASLGFYRPDSYAFGLNVDRQRRPDVTDEDIASFLVYEDLAEDAGVAISDEEHRDLMLAAFGSGKVLKETALSYQMQPRELEARIRRVRRVDKLKDFLLSGTRLPDPDTMLAGWQDRHLQYRFLFAELAGEPFVEEARGQLPEDEALLAWWQTQPIRDQSALYSEPRVVPQVAWLDLSGSFDPAALLAAFPRPDGTDEVALAQQYYDRFKALRYLKPVTPEEPKEGEGEGEKQDDADQEPADLYQPFDEVQENAKREALIEAALVDFIADIKQRVAGGAAVDLAIESAKYGLESFTAPEGMTKAELVTAPGWGNSNLAERLARGAVGSIFDNVIVDGTRMFVAKVLERTPGAERPIAEIREQVAKKWVTMRSLELAVERAESIRASLGTQPETHPEGEPWNPVATEDDFRKAATDAGLTVGERDWRERMEIPGNNFATATDAEKFLRNEASEVYGLPEGSVAAPKRAMGSEKVFLVQVAGERKKPLEDLTAKEVKDLPGSVRQTQGMELAREVFLGDSEWFKKRFNVRFPERERRAAEDAAKRPSQG